MKRRVVFAAAMASTFAVLSPVQAGSSVSTSYSYYNVSGTSLQEVYRSMASSGPMAGGVRGFGTTSISPGRRMNVASCKASGKYQLGIDMVIRLPRAKGAAKLASGDAAKWNRFVQFVKKHEETHRSIWLSCAADFERSFNAGGRGDCGSSHSRAMKLWSKMLAQCNPRQNAFDAAQRSVLKAHPFVKYASR
jgi:predicted secreted Zn-dependent protease